MGRQASVDPAACLASHCPPPHGNVSENAAFPSCTKNNNNDNLENRKDDDPEAPCGDCCFHESSPKPEVETGNRPQGRACRNLRLSDVALENRGKEPDGDFKEECPGMRIIAIKKS